MQSEKAQKVPNEGKIAKAKKPKMPKKGKVTTSKNQKVRGQVFKKYRALVVSIVVFLLLYIAVLGLNYLQSSYITQSAREIAIAGRQGDLIQQITKNLVDINLIAERMKAKQGKLAIEDLKSEVFKQYDQLSKATRLFDSSLNAFSTGGETLDANDQTVIINKIEVPKAQHNVNMALTIWRPFKGLIHNFTDGYDNNSLELDTIKFASDYARIYNKELLEDMNDLSAALQEKAEKQADFVKLIQLAGIATALLIFLFIVLHVLRSLLRSDRELDRARRETTDILDTVQEGLFLISPDLMLGNQHSKGLDKVLPVKDIAGKSFDTLISPFVTERDLSNTTRFIKQLFNKNVKESLIRDLNPLKCLTLRIENNAMFTERYLRFSFSRVYENKQIVKVLVSITNITESVLLQQQLEEEKEQNALFTEMLMKVLMIEPELLTSFIRNTDNITTRINEALKREGKSQAYLKGKVNEIFREIHSLKGESSALGLEHFVSIAEDAEDKLKSLREKSRLTGSDFISIAVALDNIIEVNQNLQDIQERLANFSTNTNKNKDDKPIKSADNIDSKETIAKQIKVFANSIAQRNAKQVKLHLEGFADNDLAMPVMDTVKEIAIQLIRNAIVHGIETPSVRLKRHKDEAGHIRLRLIRNADGYEFILEDDGNGIDMQALREKLRNHPKYQHVNVDTLNKSALYRGLFLSGISTASQPTEDAGRGEGMGIILDRIKSLKGKIKIVSIPGQLTRFAIKFDGNRRKQ